MITFQTIIMCLWFAQWCEVCERVAPLLHPKPIPCTNQRCFRTLLNPFGLNTEEKNALFEPQGPCNKKCDFKDCGLVLRHVTCGDVEALYDGCEVDSDGDTDYGSHIM